MLAALVACDYVAPTMRPVCLIVGPLIVSAACSLNNPGAAPPSGKIYFPTAVTVADGHLLVVSSNFDVRYNSGSLQAYDLAVLNEQVDACVADSTAAGCECRGQGTPCVLPGTEDLLASEVFVDSYATGIAYSAATARVYIPTRSNGGLTFVEFDDGDLKCEQDAKRCSSANVAGTERGALGLTMPPQPTTVATGAAASLGFTSEPGEYVLVGDQSGTLSLFIDSNHRPESDVPTLRYVRPGVSGPINAIAVGGRTAYLATLARSTDAAVISRVGFDTVPSQNFVASYPVGGLTIADYAAGATTVRSLAFIPGSDTEAVAVTLNPAALVRLDLARPRVRPNELLVDSVVALGSGPSQVEVGTVGGSSRDFAFVSCFDSREILVVDIELERVVSVIQGLTGPFSLALDPVRPRLYVGDFRSSTVRIVDLSPLVDAPAPETLAGGEPSSPRVIAILGRPAEVQALK